MTTLREVLALWYGDGNYNAALAALRDRVADGTFVSAIAREIKARVEQAGLTGVACSRPALSKLLNQSAEDAQLLRDAREEAGHVLAERAVEAALEAPADRDAVQQARLKVETLRWMSGKMNPQYSDKPDNSIQINSSGALFLAAAARPNALPPPKREIAPPKEVVVVEAPPPLSRVAAIRADIERTEERTQYVEDLIRNGLSKIEAERAAIQWDHDHPAPVYARVKPEEEELE